jgi:chitinase
VNILNVALANNVVLDAINVMSMDYGGTITDMGGATIQAASSLYSQLDTAYKSVGQTKTDAQLWQLVGITPMIGVNDTAGETFTLADAQNVLNVARSDGVGFVSNWSIGRDQACPNAGASPSPSCSGIDQAPYAFASIFKQLNGHWGGGVTEDPSYGGGSGTPTPGSAWSATQVYTAGMTATYQGVTYRAKWWTQGDVPGQSAVWQPVLGTMST